VRTAAVEPSRCWAARRSWHRWIRADQGRHLPEQVMAAVSGAPRPRSAPTRAGAPVPRATSPRAGRCCLR
jgi:hypothetical protein